MASYSPLVASLCKEAVNAGTLDVPITADNMTLREGLQLEKRIFHATFGLVRALASILGGQVRRDARLSRETAAPFQRTINYPAATLGVLLWQDAAKETASDGNDRG